MRKHIERDSIFQSVWLIGGPKQKLFVGKSDFQNSNGSVNAPVFDPWKEKHWDLHRRIGNKWELITSQTPGKLEPAQVSKAVLDFAQKYGDFFDPDGGENIASYLAYLRHGGSRYNRFWVQEWEDIRQALALIEEGKEYLLMGVNWSGLRAELPSLNLKLQQFTVPEMRKKRSGSSKWAVGILPTCLAGFIWILIERDVLDGVTYKPCVGFENCGREVPSTTPKGKSTKYCSERCKQREKYRKRLS